MATILTQSEIDALLNSISAGDDSGPKQEEKKQQVSLYDFRTANKFSKEQMRTLNTVCDDFASVLSNQLTGLLRTRCEVSVASVEEQLFGEFNNSIPLPALIAVVEVEPLAGPMIFQMSSAVVFGIITCLFGGAADYTEASKPFTEIDLAVMHGVLPSCLRTLGESWEKIASLKFQLSNIETSPQYTQIASMQEPAAIITFNVRMDEVEDMMAICIPHLLIQPIARQLNSVAWTSSDGSSASGREKDPYIEAQVLDTEVKLRVRTDPFTVPMKELLSMQVGDVLATKHSIKEFLSIDVEKIPKFKAVLGVNEKKRVVQIANIIKEREDIE